MQYYITNNFKDVSSNDVLKYCMTLLFDYFRLSQCISHEPRNLCFAWLEERYQNNNGKEYDLYNKNMKD